MCRARSATRFVLLATLAMQLVGCDRSIPIGPVSEEFTLDIHGVVSSQEDGSPVAGATLFLCGPTPPGFGLPWCGAVRTTASDGSFHVTDVIRESSCPLHLSISAPEFLDARAHVACTGEPQDKVVRMEHESSFVVTVSPEAVQMSTGTSVELSARVTTRRGEPISWDLSWSTSAADIATVGLDGVVTGVAEGDAVITVDAGGVPDTAQIRVTPAGAAPAGPLAYVAESGGVRVVDVGSGYVVGSPIDVAGTPGDVAASPDGRWIYVTRWASSDVVVIDRTTHTTYGAAIGVGAGPRSIVVDPGGTRAYVTSSEADEISVLDLSSNTLMKSIPTREGPFDIVLDPAGERAFVSHNESQDVAVIDLVGDVLVGAPIALDPRPQGIAMTPDGTRIYVALLFSGSVSAIDTDTWTQIGSPIEVGRLPDAIAMTPDGTRAYVANTESATVSVIDVGTNAVIETIPLGCGGADIAITPDGSTAVVTCPNAAVLVRIGVTTNRVVGDPIRLSRFPQNLTITP